MIVWLLKPLADRRRAIGKMRMDREEDIGGEEDLDDEGGRKGKKTEGEGVDGKEEEYPPRSKSGTKVEEKRMDDGGGGGGANRRGE